MLTTSHGLSTKKRCLCFWHTFFFLQNQNQSRARSTFCVPVLPLTEGFPCIDGRLCLHSAWEHSQDTQIGEWKKAFPSIRSRSSSGGQRINQPQIQTLDKNSGTSGKKGYNHFHFSFIPDLLVACAGQGVSSWQCCCSRRRTAPSPGGSYQYPGSVCTQDSSKTASHCPGLQPNCTTCPVRKKLTLFTRL